MEIKDLEAKQGNVDIVVDVIEIGETREFQKFGNTGRVTNAKVKDATGEIVLTLWNEQGDQIKQGNKIHIQNGYVNEWQGEKQLTTGKFGTLEVIDKNNDTVDESKEETKEESKEKRTDEIEEINVEEEKVEDSESEN